MIEIKCLILVNPTFSPANSARRPDVSERRADVSVSRNIKWVDN